MSAYLAINVRLLASAFSIGNEHKLAGTLEIPVETKGKNMQNDPGSHTS